MADDLSRRGLRIVSGGTDCHMFLVDLRSISITGKEAEKILGLAHLTVNKNSIPNDPESPFVTSGIRIGTPAITTRGLGSEECRQIANLLADVLHSPGDSQNIAKVRVEVERICKAFPVYSNVL